MLQWPMELQSKDGQGWFSVAKDTGFRVYWTTTRRNPILVVRPSRTKLWEGLQEDKPMYYKTSRSMNAHGSADRMKQVWEYSGEDERSDDF